MKQSPRVNKMLYIDAEIKKAIELKFGGSISRITENFWLDLLNGNSTYGENIQKLETELKETELQRAKAEVKCKQIKSQISIIKQKQEEQFIKEKTRNEKEIKIKNTCFMCNGTINNVARTLKYKGLLYHMDCHDKNRLDIQHGLFCKNNKEHMEHMGVLP